MPFRTFLCLILSYFDNYGTNFPLTDKLIVSMTDFTTRLYNVNAINASGSRNMLYEVM